VTEWTQVVPQPAAAQIVMRLSATGELLSRFTIEDSDRASLVSISPAGDIFVVHNGDDSSGTFSLAKLDAAGRPIWSKGFQSRSLFKCLAAAPTAQGGVILSGWASGDADFGGGPIMPGAAAMSFAAALDAQGRHRESRAFGDAHYINHSIADPNGGLVLAADMRGTWTLGGITVHTAAEGDTDFVLVELTPALQVVSVSRFGNGGGTQSLAGLALAPEGAAVLAGTFEGKLDLGWGVMRAVAPELTDAFLARIGDGAPAPGPAPSDGEPSLPGDLVAPAPPQIACDSSTTCDLPGSACAAWASTDAGTSIETPRWTVYYENPRCVGGRCVWDQRYFQCQGGMICVSTACSFNLP
jgi:hypothetical protein